MNLYDILIPQMTRAIGQVRHMLDKAKAYAEQKKFDPEVLLSSRLAPDQWDLRSQIQVIAMAPQRLSAMIRGGELPAPKFEDLKLDDLKALLDKTTETLKGLKPEEVQAAEERMISLPIWQGKGMIAKEFATNFAIPNFYFHVVTAYSILRHNGVDLSKLDYIGELPLRDA